MSYIKRIVGLPGEHIRMDGGSVAINGEALLEPYAQGNESVASPFPNQWVPDKAEYFVLGDQRQDSRDSRTFGPVRRSDIVGKVWVTYWPPGAWGKLD
jgi:signal peptidase I